MNIRKTSGTTVDRLTTYGQQKKIQSNLPCPEKVHQQTTMQQTERNVME